MSHVYLFPLPDGSTEVIIKLVQRRIKNRASSSENVSVSAMSAAVPNEEVEPVDQPRDQRNGRSHVSLSHGGDMQMRHHPPGRIMPDERIFIRPNSDA